MEFTCGNPHGIRPVTGPAAPPLWERDGRAWRRDSLGHSTQAMVPRPLVATRHTASLTSLPAHAVVMRRVPLRVCQAEHPHAG
jgi:hypothetical protein